MLSGGGKGTTAAARPLAAATPRRARALTNMSRASSLHSAPLAFDRSSSPLLSSPSLPLPPSWWRRRRAATPVSETNERASPPPRVVLAARGGARRSSAPQSPASRAIAESSAQRYSLDARRWRGGDPVVGCGTGTGVLIGGWLQMTATPSGACVVGWGMSECLDEAAQTSLSSTRGLRGLGVYCTPVVAPFLAGGAAVGNMHPSRPHRASRPRPRRARRSLA